jgi:hypothetical protein
MGVCGVVLMLADGVAMGVTDSSAMGVGAIGVGVGIAVAEAVGDGVGEGVGWPVTVTTPAGKG